MAKADTLSDDFVYANSGKWYGYEDLTYGGELSADGGLNIIPTADYPTLISSVAYDLTDSYITCEVVQNANVGNQTITASFGVMVGETSLEEFAIDGWGNLNLVSKVDGTPSTTAVAFNGTAHRFLRLRHISGTLYWETSPDSLAWTAQRSLTPTNSLVSVQPYMQAGFYGTEPSPGVVVFDNFNIPKPPASLSSGWHVGGSPMGASDGGTVSYRHYFGLGEWHWQPIPVDPVLDADSAVYVAILADPEELRVCNMIEYGNTIVDPPQAAVAPRRTVSLDNEPAWGVSPVPASVGIPDGAVVPPGTDGHVAVADPVTGQVVSLWQAVNTAGVWSASWAGVAPFAGTGIEPAPGSSTATAISRYACVIRPSEIEAGDIPHALFFSTDASGLAFRFPARKSDGDNLAGVATPIPQGARVQLDPSIDVTAIAGITEGEIAVARALQRYGAYCGDKGGARMGFAFEYEPNGGLPAQEYLDAGLAWDYFDMSHIPWGSLRVLKNWDGSA